MFKMVSSIGSLLSSVDPVSQVQGSVSLIGPVAVCDVYSLDL